MNSLEQHVIVKGGSVCVFGTAEKGFPYSNMGGNYLLSRLCISKRNRRILCVNLDQNKNSLLSIAKKSSDETEDLSGKLQFISGIENEEVIFSESLMDRIKSSISDLISQESSYSLIFYSLSELILTIGLKKALNFVQELLYFVQTEHSQKSASVGSTQPSVIFIVHESLHSLSVITQLQLLVNTIVKIVPNSGTLSPEVICEMQTIRKSVTTGKIMECIEMFGYKDGLLYPMQSNANSNNNNAQQVEDDEATTTQSNSNDIMSKLLNNNTAPTITKTEEVVVDASKRLITFDSTDPEFDEDSDPDADLDL